MKSYDTLTYEILEFMPFKMEFLNGNKMFVAALSRQSSVVPVAPDVCNIDHSIAPPLLDRQIIISAQQSDKLLQQVSLLLIKVWPSSLQPDSSLLAVSKRVHIFDNILCTWVDNRRVIWAPDCLRPILLFLSHDRAGHYSSTYTTDKLKENWFGPEL